MAHRTLSDEDERRAAEMYARGERCAVIAKLLGTTGSVVICALRRQGVPRRPRTLQRKHGPPHACSRCGVTTTTTTNYCLDCARDYRRGYVNGKSLRGGDVSKPPPPPPGFDERDQRVGRPYGSAFGHDADWQDGTRPEAFEIRNHAW